LAYLKENAMKVTQITFRAVGAEVTITSNEPLPGLSVLVRRDGVGTTHQSSEHESLGDMADSLVERITGTPPASEFVTSHEAGGAVPYSLVLVGRITDLLRYVADGEVTGDE
jgi:hypothetical protein